MDVGPIFAPDDPMGARRPHPTVYGLQVLGSSWRKLRSVIGEVDTSNSGNLILRVGRENIRGGWEKTEHVVLSPTEARDLVAEIQAALGLPVQ